ncbi:DUF3899 domain-containing protein [Treponema putidum]|uniref:DUF3899 domain-containing protein n=1 Tax=Treponema putidum TaxID=221027 RepID=A0ABY5HV35_9SPIR|nr:DUF3899 domain-containing protein [Treponema putidum]AIN93027.1 hypothetical protein JO40_01900 [Treponema putidum]TWI78501.1 uncharacterized protein DUF3899 [Treponema putidum]UTY29269.1 DUF3899 domain-containing protein [Treponema putidum]UTY31766.1 DUF3899 domain-containing protein [Treponema putidum]
MENKSDTGNNFFDNEVEEIVPQKKTGLLFSFFAPFGVGAVITAAVVIFFSRGSSHSFLHHLCDGLFIASVFLAGIGGLSVINKSGLFDVILFGFLQLGETIKYGVTMKKDAHVTTDFGKFKNKKNLKRKNRWGWVAAGLIYFVLAFIVLIYMGI